MLDPDRDDRTGEQRVTISSTHITHSLIVSWHSRDKLTLNNRTQSECNLEFREGLQQFLKTDFWRLVEYILAWPG